MKLDMSLSVVKEALAGLASAHAQGIVHRDISPKNLFLQDLPALPRVKLLDFGLAAYSESVMTCLRKDGTFVGTLSYMAPEQLKGGMEPDRRVDLYAMGIVLYELVTGRLPFVADTAAEAVLKIISETPPWPTELNPELPPWVEDVIMRVIRRSPADRYDSAEQMLEALEAGDGEEPGDQPWEGHAPTRAPVVPAAGGRLEGPATPGDAAAGEPAPLPDSSHITRKVTTRPDLAPTPRYVLFGGGLRRRPRLRIVVGFLLALGLSSLVPMAYADRVINEQFAPLCKELTSSLRNELRPPVRRIAGLRASQQVRASLDALRWRQFLITLGVWGCCFLTLCLLWFRFC